ncbi:PEP/pyruvate-binding domain-containing protein [Methylocella silvestris]|uniref:Pyruvate, phosphate dikinase n=1 Tax=Methylocella silvestris TaxID=199596 RepID=A0A2J7TID7_METSI|nr:PEP/pyruvate-binding domain-containing protein [Methylocella silvestris]PNG26509.1 pyruvate, phosphate dikinase [Methylocella silvestris]
MIQQSFEPVFIGATGAEDAPKSFGAKELGSKAAMLWRMNALGFAVPPAFVLPTALCRPANAGEQPALAAIDEGLRAGVAFLEQATGRRFGDARRPLLVSVRSGAERSMPGMLETVLDVGLNEVTLRGLIRLTGNPRLAFDCRRRFIESFSEVVGGVAPSALAQRLAALMGEEDALNEAELDCEALERLVKDFEAIAARECETPLPDDPFEQLAGAARAVYRSWDSPKAREYRRLNALESLQGTAVTVQAMVFGNAGGQSGAGVAFSRNPSTGAKELYVDFLLDAQGEDVVSGRRTPGGAALLMARLPQAAQELDLAAARLEAEFKDVQDIEFTVEEGKLFFLQTRAAKRAPLAAVRIAADLKREGVIDAATALQRIEGIDLATLGEQRFVGSAEAVAHATAAARGVASGRAAFDSESAKELAAAGDPVILVRPDVSTEDIAGFAAAAGILTATGGRTAHAAVVARQMGKVCLVGCAALRIAPSWREAQLGAHTVRQGDFLSLDGSSGEIFLGRREIVIERPETELAEIASWREARKAG